MTEKRSLNLNKYSQEVQRDIVRLAHILGTPLSKDTAWKEKETRLGRFGPWGDEQLGTVEVTKDLAPDEKQKLKERTIYILWQGLQNEGAGEEANILVEKAREKGLIEPERPLTTS